MASLPLSGVRIVDFCVVWAGPFATMLLGDLGAEVIKIENPHVFPPATRGGRARPPKELLQTQDAALGGFGGGPWLDGRMRMVHAAIGYGAAALEAKVEQYANVARITLDALTTYAEDVRADRQIKGAPKPGP